MTPYVSINPTSIYPRISLFYPASTYPRKGPSIKYVMLFLSNILAPSSCDTLSHIPKPPKSMSHILDPQIFSRPSTKNLDKSPLYKFSLNCSRICQGSSVWKVLSGVIFVRSPFCHFKFHVSYSIIHSFWRLI